MVAIKRLKPTWLKVATTFEKPPTPTHSQPVDPYKVTQTLIGGMIGPGQWILVEPINFIYPKQQEQQPRPLIDKWWNIDGLVQERLKSIANALELLLSCTNPMIWGLCCPRCAATGLKFRWPGCPVINRSGQLAWHSAAAIICFSSGRQSSNSKSTTNYRQVSNIRRTKSQHLKDSRTVLRLSLPNPLKPDVKSRMKM